MMPALLLEAATSEHDLIWRTIAGGIAALVFWTWILTANLTSRLAEIKKLLEKRQ